MSETVSENFSAKRTLGRTLGNVTFKLGLPVSAEYAVYWFFTQVINVTLLHGRLDGWVAAIGVTAVAYGLKHFHRQLHKKTLLDSVVEMAQFSALLEAAQNAPDGPKAEQPGNGAYL